MLDPTEQPASDVPSIGSADWSGAYAATRHLIDLGHREIAIITGPEDMMAATARLSGFRAALEAARIPLDPKYVRRGEFHHSDGLTEGRALLSMPLPPTAIFASSDVQALGVYEAARALGVAIPSELSVVGFDDLKIARWAGPALTTIRVPIAEMAEQAVHVVLNLAQERAVCPWCWCTPPDELRASLHVARGARRVARQICRTAGSPSRSTSIHRSLQRALPKRLGD